jgi:hypothetical protein
MVICTDKCCIADLNSAKLLGRILLKTKFDCSSKFGVMDYLVPHTGYRYPDTELHNKCLLHYTGNVLRDNLECLCDGTVAVKVCNSKIYFDPVYVQTGDLFNWKESLLLTNYWTYSQVVTIHMCTVQNKFSDTDTINATSKLLISFVTIEIDSSSCPCITRSAFLVPLINLCQDFIVFQLCQW